MSCRVFFVCLFVLITAPYSRQQGFFGSLLTGSGNSGSSNSGSSTFIRNDPVRTNPVVRTDPVIQPKIIGSPTGTRSDPVTDSADNTEFYSVENNVNRLEGFLDSVITKTKNKSGGFSGGGTGTELFTIGRVGPGGGSKSVVGPHSRGRPDYREYVDFIFLLDVSGSVSYAGFRESKCIMRKVTEILEADRGILVRVAVITFAEYARTEFHFNTFSNVDGVLRGIDNIRYTSGRRTCTDQALREANDLFRRHSTGSATQVVMVITDGRSNCDFRSQPSPYYQPRPYGPYQGPYYRNRQFQQSQLTVIGGGGRGGYGNTCSEAESLKRKGVEIFAFGVGRKINRYEIECISSPGQNNLNRDFFEACDVVTRVHQRRVRY